MSGNNSFLKQRQKMPLSLNADSKERSTVKDIKEAPLGDATYTRIQGSASPTKGFFSMFLSGNARDHELVNSVLPSVSGGISKVVNLPEIKRGEVLDPSRSVAPIKTLEAALPVSKTFQMLKSPQYTAPREVKETSTAAPPKSDAGVKSSDHAGQEPLSHSENASPVVSAAEQTLNPPRDGARNMALEPRVMLPYVTAPGCTPRRVEVERKKRLYASSNLESLIRDAETSANIDNSDEEFIMTIENTLPLELFDDDTMETRTWQEWTHVDRFPQCPNDVPSRPIVQCTVPLPAKVYDQDTLRWVLSEVLAYNKLTSHWLVQISRSEEGNDTLLDSEPQWKTRLEVYFLAENPKTFAQRIASAKAERRRAAYGLLLETIVDQMPGTVNCDGFDAILRDSKLLQRFQTVNSQNLLAELRMDFAHCANRQRLELDLTNPAQSRIYGHLGFGNYPEFFSTTRCLEAVKVCQLASLEGSEYQFAKQKQAFLFNSHWSHTAVFTLYKNLKQISHPLWTRSVVHLQLSKPLKADEFEQMQSQAMATAHQYIVGHWVSSVKSELIEKISKIGKGWYNLQETNQEVYNISKLKKVMTAVKLMMQDSLRSVALQSMQRFVYLFWRTAVQVVANLEQVDKAKWGLQADGVPSEFSNALFEPVWTGLQLNLVLGHVSKPNMIRDANATDKEASGKRDAAKFGSKFNHRSSTSPHALKAPNFELKPLFKIEVVWKDNSLHFATEPQQFVKAVLDVFDNIKNVVQDVPDIEPSLMNQMFWSSQPTLQAFRVREASIARLRQTLERALEMAIVPLERYKEKLTELVAAVFSLNLENFHKEYRDNDNLTLEAMVKDVHKYRREQEQLAQQVQATVNVGLFTVHCESLVKLLKKDLAKAVLQALHYKTEQMAKAILQRYGEVVSVLDTKPSKIELVQELWQYLDTVPQILEELSARYRQLTDYCDALELFSFESSSELVRSRWTACGMPKVIEEKVEQATAKWKQDEQLFQKHLLSDQESFRDRWHHVSGLVSDFAKFADLNRITETLVEVQKVAMELKECLQLSQLFNTREKLFKQPLTDYSELQKLQQDFEPFKLLWTSAHDWSKWKGQWLHGPFLDLQPADMEKNLSGAIRNMNKSSKQFSQYPQVLGIAQQIIQQMEQFKPNVPLVQQLRNPGLRDRHWLQLSELLGIELKPSPELTLTELIRLGLLDKFDAINKVCDVASKEYAIESALDKMEVDWQSIHIDAVPYRDAGDGKSGTWLVKIGEETLRQLDDHIVMTQSMSFSPFKKYFSERICSWESQLKTVQDVLEAWMQCQKLWLYLEPIFQSDDMIEQLPTEAKRFQGVNKNWRKVMNQAKTSPLLVQFCSDHKLLDFFKDATKSLEVVSKGLSTYLESKRIAFPRFFFLSDDELLQILSQAKDANAVQPHLRKCFENVASLEFESGADGQWIAAMFSAEGERLPVAEKFQPKGNVEEWLLKTENAMKMSVKASLGASLASYYKQPRSEYVLKWPGQVVLSTCLTYWTQQVHAAIEQDTLPELYELQLTQLQELVALVRGELPFLARLILGDLIVMDVHCRDVVHNLVESKIKSVTDFEWSSQLRYYWEDDTLKVRIVNACFNYGYEYLGNTGRLVMTPLTDRCYLTLTGALHLGMGGAPAGPAGTGKTETTKDLAKALAKQCVVFNCSDQLDYLAMAKFFKGIASSGAWACFDEFNRIDIEVLSVVAQQVLTIQTAIALKLTRFTFEGAELSFDPTNGIFITMNPGYAGRTELPDNLKALFRSVAMMIPNYVMIAEISLFSFGFAQAKALAEKMVATFKLSSEQLSSQDHYDFGMRAVKSVLFAAGALKREQPNTDESWIVQRALCDCNLPKFLADDVPLFRGILSDLFPGSTPPAIDYSMLEKALQKSCAELDLQATETFVSKCLQLYDTTQVRHGLMLVGPSGGGKTSALRSLSGALTSLQGQVALNGLSLTKVVVKTMNPKSVTMGQLYGEFDSQTHEWSDGVFASLLRDVDQSVKQWFVFDGPVDAIWIESMNTLLDDNKKLCLTSGEIIKMSPNQTIVFEVDHLAFASPATVSRCGMVYMEPNSLGLEPLLNSWLDRQGSPESRELIRKWYNSIFLGALEYSITLSKDWYPVQRGNLLQSFLRLSAALTAEFSKAAQVQLADVTGATDADSPGASGQFSAGAHAEKILLLSLVWSLGGGLDAEGRRKFDQYIRSEGNELTNRVLPDDESVFDVILDVGTGKWINWMSSVATFEVDKGKLPFDIVVPTTDSVRHSFILKALVNHGTHVLFVGPTGTGKTVTLNETLSKSLDANKSPIGLHFSARTTANQTQDVIDKKLDKRRKGVFGPPLGKTFVLFVDDLNMPLLDVCDSQPAVELLRQWLDHKGWYDRKNVGQFMELADVQFVGAMGPPGGGRNKITPRFTRHCQVLAVPELETTSMLQIFMTMTNAFLPSGLIETAEHMVKASLFVYQTIRKELLPTPAKTHYTFNLRDLAKTVNGVLLGHLSQPVSTPLALAKLWTHESLRVFSDRLVDSTDKLWFKELLGHSLQSHFQLNLSDIVTQEPFLYGDFVSKGISGGKRAYTEITDLRRLVKTGDEVLEEYNNSGIGSAPVKLVLFLDAMDHLARLARILRQPAGHALLLGVGGSGRQSLTRLAAFMIELELFQIQVSKSYGLNDWKEDLKKVLLGCGIDFKPTVFLFADTQVISESQLEDLNNLLNVSDVPNIYSAEDFDRIQTSMRVVAQQDNPARLFTKEECLRLFRSRVKQTLHLVVSMSPLGDAFRTRLRLFPSLVNCCTIDWFNAWPQEALRSVAADAFADVQQLGAESVMEGVLQLCTVIHDSVRMACESYKQELGRHNYVTPKSYLELLHLYKRLLESKRSELNMLKKRTSTGLEKLLNATKEVQLLQEELEAMQPMLLQTSQEVDLTMKKIAADKIQAEELKENVSREELEASKKAEETKTIADDAQRDLDEALPALEAALESLNSLSKQDIIEVRSMQRPPDGVKLVMEAVCILRGVKPRKIDGDKPGKKIDDYWEPGRALLADPAKFLESLVTFDKDSISESTIQKLKPYIDSPDFQVSVISRVSKAATSICAWCRAMEKYYWVSKTVEPKRARLAEARASLQETMTALASSKKKMKDVELNIKEMEKRFQETLAKKQELANKVNECNVKLGRASKLISGLGGERQRWSATVCELDKKLETVVGDTLLSAGALAYLGPFTSEFRAQLLQRWADEMEQLQIPHTSPTMGLWDCLGDPVQLRSWELCGLPKDAFSRDNALMIFHSRRWPLLIDPQGQANKFIRRLESDRGLDVVKLTDRDLLRTLENAIRFGRPVLLENIDEKLDPALEPILNNQTYMHGGTLVIKLGDNVIPFHQDFKFYMTTKWPNPHYLPEISATVSLINFTLAASGLEDQLLALVVANERPDLEEAKAQLVMNNAAMAKELKEIQDKILYLLSSVQGSPVDDERLIDTLAASKETSEEIQAKVAAAEATERDIDATRSEYFPVAVRTRILFFCITELANIDPMYQYSLNWFMNLFTTAMSTAEKAADTSTRIVNINSSVTYSLFANVCRSLFERHKLLFSFLLAARILADEKLIQLDEYKFLLTGIGANSAANSSKAALELPAAAEWVSPRAWSEVQQLATLPHFKNFDSQFISLVDNFKLIFDSSQPFKEPLPGKWDAHLSEFQKLLVLRTLRPDKVFPGVQAFIGSNFGERFVEAPGSDLSVVYKESNSCSPLIFVLSSGTDPASALLKFAEEMRCAKKLFSVSLGQGQGPKAEALIREGMEKGHWVLLQNCHLAPSWMPTLDRIVDSFVPVKVHREFRLWLTSMPTPKFPVAILQNGLKMTMEPPAGLRANLLRTFNGFTDETLGSCARPRDWKKLLCALSFFHAVVQERRKFGALGWNIPYEFTDGDLQICVRQLKMFLEEYTEIPFKVLRYTVAEVNYGGRVTDDHDRRLMNCLIQDFYNPKVLEDNHPFSESPLYKSVVPGGIQDYRNYIKSLPINESTEIFSMHENASITFAQREAYTMFEQLALLMPKARAAAGEKTREELLLETCSSIQTKIPKPFDLAAVAKKYPTDYKESMSTVLVQEVVRYNRLLSVIHQVLPELIKALQGLVVMSEALELCANSIYLNQVPAVWAAKAYPSLKPLSSWVNDLHARCDVLSQWILNGVPTVFWISGMFFPQAFLTGTLQNFARKYSASIDLLSFEFKVLDPKWQDLATKPQDGCYVRGLYLEGARWDATRHLLAESRPKELFTEMNVIWLLPKLNRRKPETGVYECPVYKTVSRAGTLSTTGHSTNYVLTVELLSEHPRAHWIKRGVALVCSLPF